MAKYRISTSYYKRSKILCIEQSYDCGTYEEAFRLHGDYLAAKKIGSGKIIGHKVVRVVRCPVCGKEIALTGVRNFCGCGAALDEAGKPVSCGTMDYTNSCHLL